MPKAKVEKWKMTPQTIAFIKQYKQVKKVGDFLQKNLEVQLIEADVVRSMLMETEGAKEKLLSNPPQHPVFSVSDQDIDQFKIQY